MCQVLFVVARWHLRSDDSDPGHSIRLEKKDFALRPPMVTVCQLTYAHVRLVPRRNFNTSVFNWYIGCYCTNTPMQWRRQDVEPGGARRECLQTQAVASPGC